MWKRKRTIPPKPWCSSSWPNKHQFLCRKYAGWLNLNTQHTLPWNTFRDSNSLSSGPLYRGLDVYASHSPCTPIFASCAQLGTRVPPFQARPDEGGRICQSPLFGQVIETRGPFETYADLTHFFNDRLVQTLQSEARTLSSQGKPPSPVDSLTTFDDSQPLVLTHQDLNSRNFIVGDDGHLWLVDWAWAGFYPPWFEFVAMRRQAENEELVTRQKNPAWDAMIPFVCGWFFEHEKWLNRMARSLYWI